MDAGEALRTFIEVLSPMMKELNRTILYGWPFEEYPTEREGWEIVEAYQEISIHKPEMDEQQRWYIAGRIVARFRRLK